jgi:dipeptide/tripeptide permease
MSSVMTDPANAKPGQALGLGAAFAELGGKYWLHGLVAALGPIAGLLVFGYRQRQSADAGFLAIVLHCWRERAARQPGEGFFAPARTHFGEEAAEGPPAVLRIMVVFSMVTVFWALFEQHSSTWVEQAKSMNLVFEAPRWVWSGFAVPATVAMSLFGAVWLFAWVGNRKLPRIATQIALGVVGAWGLGALALQATSGGVTRVEMQAAQIAALNPLMVMIIIPLLNVFVYKPLDRRGTPLKPLARMAIGMFLAALSFVAVALLQARIDAAPPKSLHVLWQVIPYLIVTVSEVLVSVTGLAFAYTQAPRAMKSTIMGFWLLCVTFGNILVAFLAPLQRLSLEDFFWVFAALMGVAAVVFSLLARTYKGKTYLQAS